jgi:hypothetical protein
MTGPELISALGLYENFVLFRVSTIITMEKALILSRLIRWGKTV